MILYFSGTGNSLHIAKALAELLHEEAVNMESGISPNVVTSENALGIIFPVYAWGVPKIVADCLQGVSISSKYVWTVMTCGDDMGYADSVLERIIGRRVDAAFSLLMPNTYVCLPGFNVDASELAARKLMDSEGKLPRIAEFIKSRKQGGELTRGAMAWMKTYVLRPLFNRFLVTDSYFRVSDDCTGCGACARRCPAGNIEMMDGRPMWKHGACTGCLRCFHNCPKRAIDWGTFTKGKGQKESLSKSANVLGV